MARLVMISVLAFVFAIPSFADVVELPATGDVFVSEYSPSTNHNDKAYINWGKISNLNRWGLIVFDGLSGYTGITLASATLSVYIIRDLVYYDNYLRRIIEDWDEDTVTWNNRPDNTTQGELEFTTPEINEWLDLDVTEIVQDWLDGTYPNYGFCFLRVDNLSIWWRFHSREYSDPDFRPKLTLDYTSPVESTSLGTVKAAFR